MAIKVAVGNRIPRNGHNNDDGTTTYTTLPEGEYVTEVFVQGDSERLLQVSESLKLHFSEGTVPVWVECDDKDLLAGLVRLYRIENNARPETWGK
jgi:hypothetical protein